MYSSTSNIKDDVRNLKAAGQNLRDDAVDATDEAKQGLREVANKAGRQVRQFIDSASDELTDAGDKVTKQIRSNPVQSSALALGIGFVLGALFRR